MTPPLIPILLLTLIATAGEILIPPGEVTKPPPPLTVPVQGKRKTKTKSRKPKGHKPKGHKPGKSSAPGKVTPPKE